ncbi:hypothetical protein SCHPADRAFT_686540 [Schizopora paradoxa]|uniref:Uncharacterized protein n=1 Tax=Schizopora paradoxa TaxID=27342 RepID=A0A0H2RP46_9AGAM|nr:hypothetical protein SCHPADRAFT_686540 [Schizopora paradoxa]
MAMAVEMAIYMRRRRLGTGDEWVDGGEERKGVVHDASVGLQPMNHSSPGSSLQHNRKHVHSLHPPSLIHFITWPRPRPPRHHNLRFWNPFLVYGRATARDGDEENERDGGPKLTGGIDDDDEGQEAAVGTSSVFCRGRRRQHPSCFALKMPCLRRWRGLVTMRWRG